MTDQRPPGPSLAASLVVIGLGVAVGAVGVVETALPFVRTLTRSTAYTTPAVIHAHLSHGTYEIYQLTSRRSSSFSPVQPGTVDIQPTDVSVTSSGGQPLRVEPQGTRETITHNDDVYTGAVRFAVPSTGDYVVRVRSGRAAANQVILARSLGSLVRSAVGWIATAAAGGLIVLLGLVMLIVGLVRRRRPAVALPGGMLPPASWYPDPSDPAQQRYWDGHQWTDQTHRP